MGRISIRHIGVTALAVIYCIACQCLSATAALPTYESTTLTMSETVSNATDVLTMGWRFTAKADIKVSSLGFYNKGNGHKYEHRVALWNDQGNLLADAIIPRSSFKIDPLDEMSEEYEYIPAPEIDVWNNYSYRNIETIILQAGHQYTISVSLPGIVLSITPCWPPFILHNTSYNSCELLHSVIGDQYPSIRYNELDFPLVAGDEIEYIHSCKASTPQADSNQSELYFPDADIDYMQFLGANLLFEPVPEPTTLMILLGGLTILANWRQRYKLHKIAVITALLACSPIANGEIIEFESSVIREAVNRQLGYGYNSQHQVTSEEILTITELYCCTPQPDWPYHLPSYAYVDSLADLRHLTNLERLVIGDVVLTQNPVSIPTIEQLSNLKQLSVCGYQGNINDFFQLKNLEELSISDWGVMGHPIQNVSGIEELTKLSKVWIDSDDLSDISGLSLIPNLKTLHISCRNMPESIKTQIANIANLDTLSLYFNNISDISFIAALRLLETINLAQNSIEDIAALVSLHNLKKVNLRSNPLNDEAYNIYIPQIRENNPGVELYYDIPEPASALFLLGGFGISVLMRRKRGLSKP